MVRSGLDAPSADDTSGDGERSSREPAVVLALVLYWLLVPTLALSIVGLVLAVLGWFYPLVFLLTGVPVAAALSVAAWQPYREAVSATVVGGVLPVALVVIVIAASAASAAFFSGEHMPTDRDPAVYLSTGRALADTGTLLVLGQVGGFAEVEEVTSQSPGYKERRDDGTLDPQFLHLFPVWGAVAHWVGGDQALLRINAIIAAMALGAFWLFAATVLRSWFALLATTSFAVLLPTVHFARDLYSEPLALLVIFGGLAFLGFARLAAEPALSLVAGIMAGAVTMVRIDGWLVVIALVAYLMAVRWTARESGNPTAIRGFAHPALVGLLLSGSVALFDGMVRSRNYLEDLGGRIALMWALLIVVAVIGIVAPRWPQPVRRLTAWVTRHRGFIAWVVPIAIVAAAGFFAFVWPAIYEGHKVGVDPSIEFLQRLDGLPVDGTRIYPEWSMRWLSWYLGALGLALGVVGIAWAWRRSILGRNELWPYLLVVSLVTFTYVIRPSITPDQLWAMRRFLPVVLPGLIVAGVLATQWGVDRLPRAALRWVAAAGAVLALVIVPASFTQPLAASTSYVGMYGAIDEICATLPDDGAMLVTIGYGQRYQAPVRSFCGVPVAAIWDFEADWACVIAEADAAWDARGVDLMIGYGDDDLAFDPSVVVSAEFEQPEFRLAGRPDRLIERSWSINLANADRVDRSHCP